MVFSDLTAITLAYLAGLLVSGNLSEPADRDGLLIVFVQVLPLWVLGAYAANLYHDFEQRIDRNFVEDASRLACDLDGLVVAFRDAADLLDHRRRSDRHVLLRLGIRRCRF